MKNNLQNRVCHTEVEGVGQVFKCATACAGLDNCRIKLIGRKVKLGNGGSGIIEKLEIDPLGFDYGIREDSGKLYWHHSSTFELE